MCGIIAAFSTKEDENPINQEIIDQFEDQQSRGTKGFGIISINPEKQIQVFKACEPYKFLLDLYFQKSKMLIVHHRTPTSSPNWIEQAHPIFVSNPALNFDYYVIHNGMISNAEFLREKHEKEYNFQYSTLFTDEKDLEKFNDSESLAIELAIYIEGIQKSARFGGSAAFIALQINKKTGTASKVFYGRNDRNPLKIAATRRYRFLSSEGKGNDVKPGVLYSFKPEGEMKINNRPLIITTEYKPYPQYNQPVNHTPGYKQVEGFKVKETTKQSNFIKHEEDDFVKKTKTEALEGYDDSNNQDTFDESDTFSGPHAQEFEDIFDTTQTNIEDLILEFFEAAQRVETSALADPRETADKMHVILKEASRKIQEIHDIDTLDLINDARYEDERELPFEDEKVEKTILTPTIFRKSS